MPKLAIRMRLAAALVALSVPALAQDVTSDEYIRRDQRYRSEVNAAVVAVIWKWPLSANCRNVKSGWSGLLISALDTDYDGIRRINDSVALNEMAVRQGANQQGILSQIATMKIQATNAGCLELP